MARLRGQGAYKIRPIPQTDNATCWIAAYQMLYQVEEYSTYDVIPKLQAAGLNTNTTLSQKNYVAAADALNLTCVSPGLLLDMGSAVNAIGMYGVMKLSIEQDDGTAHAIILVGVDPDANQAGIINPWWDDEYTKGDVKENWVSFDAICVNGLKNRVAIPGVVQCWG
jgi:hypothetical protein